MWPDSIGAMSDRAAMTYTAAAKTAGKRGWKGAPDSAGEVKRLAPEEEERQCRPDLLDGQHHARHGGERGCAVRTDRGCQDRDHDKFAHTKTGRQQHENISRDVRCSERPGCSGPRQVDIVQRPEREELQRDPVPGP